MNEGLITDSSTETDYKEQYSNLKTQFDELQTKYGELEQDYNAYKFNTEFESDIINRNISHISDEDKEILRELKKHGNEKIYESYAKSLEKKRIIIGGPGNTTHSYTSTLGGFSGAVAELREEK